MPENLTVDFCRCGHFAHEGKCPKCFCVTPAPWFRVIKDFEKGEKVLEILMPSGDIDVSYHPLSDLDWIDAPKPEPKRKPRLSTGPAPVVRRPR